MKKAVITLVAVVICGISLQSATAQEQTKVALLNYQEVAATMPEYKEVLAEYKLMEEVWQEIKDEIDNFFPKRVALTEKRMKEVEKQIKESGEYWVDGRGYKVSRIEELARYKSDLHYFRQGKFPITNSGMVLQKEYEAYKERLSKFEQIEPKSKKLLDEKLREHQQSIRSKYNVLCLFYSELLYYSSDVPDVTQWFAESIAGKTASAPNIGNAPQKIGVVSDKVMEMGEKPLQIISALGGEGKFTFVINVVYMQFFSKPNEVMDLTDKVLEKMK